MLDKILINIINEKYNIVNDNLKNILNEKKLSLLESVKRKINDTIFNEANTLYQGRTKLIRRRIRKGKVQRNIRRSSVKGFMYRSGKLVRIPVLQKIKMKRSARRAARIRKAHMQIIIRKRQRSLMRRKSMGIR